MNRFAILALTAFLTGCTTAAGVKSDPHTGTTTTHSAIYPANDGFWRNMKAQVFHTKGSGYAVRTNTSSQGWMFLNSAYSYGSKLPYSVTDTSVALCSSTGCINTEQGVFLLTDAQFKKAAASGFEFKLVGKRGSIVGKLPAKAFSEVAALRK